MASLRLLILEDSAEDEAKLLQAFAGAGYRVEHQRVQTPAGLYKVLEESRWDIIISDFQLKQLNSLEALYILHASEQDIPFIVVSGAAGEEIAVEAMRAGADDYLMKDNLKRLLPAVERARREAQNRRQRKQAEQELEETRHRLEGIIASAMDAIITVSQEHAIVLFNAAAEQMFGYRAEEVLGRPMEFLLPERYRANHAQNIQRFATTGQSSRNLQTASHIYGLNSNGEEFPIEASISQVTVGDSKFFTVIIRDITKSVDATRKLEEEKQRLELALVGGGLGLWDWTLPTDRVVMSEHWATIMGYEPSELVDTMKGILEQVHAEDLADLGEATSNYMMKPEGYLQHEYRIRNRAGEWRWVLTTGRVFEWDEQGAPLRLVGTHQDITEKKAVARKMQQMEVEMLSLKIAEQRVISNAFLKGQEDERKRLARELHDGIGQLMSALKIQLSMESASLEVRQSVDHIVKEIVRINNNLMPLVLQDFGLEAGLRQLVERSRSLSRADIYFYSNLEGRRFNQELEISIFRIVQEATTNALKYSQASQISVQLTLQEQSLLLMVEDNGIGFNPQESRQRLDKGFGLVNMQYRVEALEGELLIESSPGQGCLVNVVLPI